MRRPVGVLAAVVMLTLPAMAIARQPGKTMNATGTVSAVTTGSLTVKGKAAGEEWKFMIDKDTSVVSKGATHKSLALKADGKTTVLTDFVKTGDTVHVNYHDLGSMKQAATINVTMPALK